MEIRVTLQFNIVCMLERERESEREREREKEREIMNTSHHTDDPEAHVQHLAIREVDGGKNLGNLLIYRYMYIQVNVIIV